MFIAGKKIIKHYEETMSFKKLLESNRSLSDKFGNLSLV